MTVDGERNFAKMIPKEVEATSWRLRENVRFRELAATHRIGQMRHLPMLEEQKAWKREAGFDYIETAAEMDARRSRSKTFFYRNMFNPSRPHTPAEFTLEMNVDVERLRMEIIISQPAPPQCDPLPRRAAVDTGSEEPGTPRRSSAIGTGLGEPRVSRVETSTEEGGFLPLETSMNGFLHFNFTSPEQECIMFQSDVGVDDNDESTTSKAQAAPARSLRDCQLADSNERQLQPSKTSTLTGVKSLLL